jgi:hypothetical protein
MHPSPRAAARELDQRLEAELVRRGHTAVHRPGLPPVLSDIILRLLEKAPATTIRPLPESGPISSASELVCACRKVRHLPPGVS